MIRFSLNFFMFVNLFILFCICCVVYHVLYHVLSVNLSLCFTQLVAVSTVLILINFMTQLLQRSYLFTQNFKY